MGPETLSEHKRLYSHSWADVSSYLPEDLDPNFKKFVRDYYRAQLRIANGAHKKAKRILDGLDKRHGFREFEMKNQPLLTAIEMAVRGNSTRVDPMTGEKVKPLFTVNHKG